jgi:hypothetical protein
MKFHPPLKCSAGKRAGIGRNSTTDDYTFIRSVGLKVGQEVPNSTNGVQIFIFFARRKQKSLFLRQGCQDTRSVQVENGLVYDIERVTRG